MSQKYRPFSGNLDIDFGLAKYLGQTGPNLCAKLVYLPIDLIAIFINMAAGIATLNHIDINNDKIYRKINELGTKVRAGLTKIFGEAKIDVQVTGEGSIFLTHFLNNKVRGIRNATD